MLKKFVAIACVSSSLFFAGCASVPMASKELDTQAKSFATEPAKAKIYVYRNESFGGAVKMPVVMDGKVMGDTAAKTYLLQTVEPGKHLLVSKTENDAKLDIVAEAGKNYFVWQEVKMGVWAAGSALHLVDEAKGKQAVKECNLVQPQS